MPSFRFHKDKQITWCWKWRKGTISEMFISETDGGIILDSLPHSFTFLHVHLLVKSNHFYRHITTAQVPRWVKFLRACSRQCRNNLHIDSTYLQTYTEDNVQNTHTYTPYTQCTIKTYLVINTHYTPYVHILHFVHIYIYTHTICEGAADFT